MFTHFTEEERLEQEDLVLHDQSSSHSSQSHSPLGTATPSPTASVTAPLPEAAAARPPQLAASLHDSAEARTQRSLHTAGLTHEQAPRMYATQSH